MMKEKHSECRQIFVEVKRIFVNKQFEANGCKNIFSYTSTDTLQSTKPKQDCKSNKHRTSWNIAAYTLNLKKL